MRLILIILLVILVTLIVACQGPPPTQIILVVTATPDAQNTIVGPVTSGEPNSQQADTTPEVPSATATPTSSPTPDPFPTPVISEIYVAEQRFENGRMFWLQPVDQIWVMTLSENRERVWSVYDDTFQDGELESDPGLTPPEGMLQPVRGFGKLWRENQEIRSALGWAIEPEWGHNTSYEYHAGGTVENNTYIAGPGYHVLESLYGDQFRFDEGTWQWRKL